jgi:ATP/maltotriose-dependent transcriptional regulator MalT
MRQAGYALRQKDFSLMINANKQAIAAAGRAGNHDLEVQALTGQVTALAYTGDWDAAEQTVTETLEKLPSVVDDVLRAYVLGDMGFYYCRVGDSSRALTLMQQGAAAAHCAGNRQKESRLALNIGFVKVQLGQYAEAQAVFESGLALAAAIGDQALQTSHRYNLSYALWYNGDQDGAQRMAEKALQAFRAADTHTIGHACCLAYLGIYLVEAGDLAGAAAYLGQSGKMYVHIGAKSYRMEAQAVEAYCMLLQDRCKQAEELAVEVWAYVREHGTVGMDFPSRVYVCLADVFSEIAAPDVTVREVLETGYGDLIQRAEKISDPDWRRSFLENVIENRTIVARWEKICQTSHSASDLK